MIRMNVAQRDEIDGEAFDYSGEFACRRKQLAMTLRMRRSMHLADWLTVHSTDTAPYASAEAHTPLSHFYRFHACSELNKASASKLSLVLLLCYTAAAAVSVAEDDATQSFVPLIFNVSRE